MKCFGIGISVYLMELAEPSRSSGPMNIKFDDRWPNRQLSFFLFVRNYKCNALEHDSNVPCFIDAFDMYFMSHGVRSKSIPVSIKFHGTSDNYVNDKTDWDFSHWALFSLHCLIYAAIHDLFFRAHTHTQPSIHPFYILQIKSLIKRDERIVSFSSNIASGD